MFPLKLLMAGDPAPPDAPEDSSENLDNNSQTDWIFDHF